MKLPRNRWPNTPSGRGLVFFAQLIQEMLSPDTFESFRAMSLDSLARIDEALLAINDVLLNRIPKATLAPVFAELAWSLRRDPVATKQHRDELQIIVKNLEASERPLSDKVLHLNLLKTRLSRTYKTSLEDQIVSCFTDDRQRIKLRVLAGFYCSHLLNMGYSKDHIIRGLRVEFLTEDMGRAGDGAFRRFFMNFDGKLRDIIVVMPLDGIFAQYLRKLDIGESVVDGLARLPPSAADHFRNDTSPHFLIQEVKALDEEQAGAKVQQTIGSISAIAHLAPRVVRFDLRPAFSSRFG